MKVLLVHHRTGLGGGERSLLSLIGGLNRTNMDVSLVCPEEGRFPEEARRLNVTVYPMSFSGLRHPWRLVKNWRSLIRLARKKRFDVMHGNSPQTNLVTGLAGKSLGTPVVWHARVLLEEGMIDWDLHLAPLSSLIVCNSEAIRSRFAAIKDFDARTVTVLNGVDVNAFKPGASDGVRWRKSVGIPQDEPVVGCFDRLDPVKNHEVILRAFKTARTALGAGTMIVIGEAFVHSRRRLSDLKDAAQGLGVAQSVRFLGFMEDVRPAMAASDVIVQASRSEGCSRVLCEAQAVGKPVVASRVGGNPEIVRDGVTGFLCPASDHAAFSKRLVELLGNERMRLAMARRARLWAEEALSLERHCREMERVYRRVTS